MSRKRKGTKRKSVRRRRVGAMSLNARSPLIMYGPLVGGFLFGDGINGLIDKAVPDDKVDQKTKGFIEGGLGAGLLLMKLGPRKSVPQVVIGGLMAGAGVRRLLKEFNIISGIGNYQSVPVIARRRQQQMNGYGAVPVVGGNSAGGYSPNRYALNGALNGVGGYNVPPVPAGARASSVMNGIGNGLSNGGSNCME